MSPHFPGALGKTLALKGGKQFASLCKRPFHSELMLFPKVHVHCCWAMAKGSLPSPSGGDNNAHVCHFLTLLGIAGLIFTTGKKKKIPFGKPTPTPLKKFHLPDCFTSRSSALADLALHCQGRVLLSGDSAPRCPAGPRGRGRSRRGGGSGTSRVPHLLHSASPGGLQGAVPSETTKLEPKIISELSKYITTGPYIPERGASARAVLRPRFPRGFFLFKCALTRDQICLNKAQCLRY